jgi:hypothetical protein
MAEQYPSAQVIGIDISFIQPCWVPSNLRFVIDDINSRAYREVERYDMIHGRGLDGSVLDWPGLIGKCFEYVPILDFVHFLLIHY